MSNEKVGPECFGGEDPPHAPSISDRRKAEQLAAPLKLELPEDWFAPEEQRPEDLPAFEPVRAIERLREDERTGRGLGACSATLCVGLDGLRHLLAEHSRLSRQVTRLFEESTKAKNESLYRRVRAFHDKFGHPVRHTPAVPTEAETRFRLSLIKEEFLELLAAAFGVDPRGTPYEFAVAENELDKLIRTTPVRLDLEAFYDALLDLSYVIEGTHAVCGTRAEPGIDEVQRANMSKDPVYVDAKDASHRGPDPQAKPRKPEGWMPPNIRAVLIAQGWTPPSTEEP